MFGVGSFVCMEIAVRRRFGIMAFRRLGRCFPNSLHVVDVGHVGFDIEAARRDVVWSEFLMAYCSVKVLTKALVDRVSN